jgi:hypothetical protein
MGLRDLFRRNTPEARLEPRIEFLGEQDGPAERELKTALTTEFARPTHVVRAYLARVGYQPEARPGVALCVRLSGGDEKEVARRIGVCFAALFATGVPLDILFISAEQEADLERVCPAFYPAAV